MKTKELFNDRIYLCPCGTCLPQVTNSRRGRLKIWFRKASSSLIVFTMLIFGVLESSCLSLIIVTCVLSGSRRLSLPVLFCLNSFGGLDLKAEYETNAISGEPCISKTRDVAQLTAERSEPRKVVVCKVNKKCKFDRKLPSSKIKFIFSSAEQIFNKISSFIYCKWLLFPQYQILMTLKINEWCQHSFTNFSPQNNFQPLLERIINVRNP